MLGHSRFQKLILQRLFYCSHHSITWVIVHPDVFKIMKKAICFFKWSTNPFQATLRLGYPGCIMARIYIFFIMDFFHHFSYMLMAFLFHKTSTTTIFKCDGY